jgi:hypothetical protein
VVGGAAVETVESVDTESGVATVTAGDVSASISGQQSDAASDIDDNDNSLVFDAGDSLTVGASGFAPETEASVVIYSEPRQLGTLFADAQGNIQATVSLPTDLESGNHTLVITGSDKDGNLISVKFGLIVFGNERQIPIWMWFLVVGLVAILTISLAVNLRSRRSPQPV